MSRYILLPSKETNVCSLIPYDGINNERIAIPLANELNPFIKSYEKVKNKPKLNKIVLRLIKSKIYRNNKGQPTDGQITLDIDFDNAIVDLCNEYYSDYYKSFYALLGKYAIL